MNKIALVTVLFDYPEFFMPSFYKNAIKYFDEKDIHIIRKSGLVTDGSYYDKLFYYKVVELLNYLEINLLGKYEYILFLDATDTNFIKEPIDLIENFEKLNVNIIMGAEKWLWPNTNYSHLYEKKEAISESKFLNSGTYFGYTDKIIFHLKDIIEKEYQTGIDDQGRWSIQYLINNDIKIDQNRDFFFSTLDTKEDIIIEDSKVFLKNLNAFIIHDNGPHTENTIKLTNLINENS